MGRTEWGPFRLWRRRRTHPSSASPDAVTPSISCRHQDGQSQAGGARDPASVLGIQRVSLTSQGSRLEEAGVPPCQGLHRLPPSPHLCLDVRWASGVLSAVWRPRQKVEQNPRGGVCTCASREQLFATLTAARQVPPSMGFPRRGHWSGLPFPPPGDLPESRIEPESPALWTLYP